MLIYRIPCSVLYNGKPPLIQDERKTWRCERPAACYVWPTLQQARGAHFYSLPAVIGLASGSRHELSPRRQINDSAAATCKLAKTHGHQSLLANHHRAHVTYTFFISARACASRLKLVVGSTYSCGCFRRPLSRSQLCICLSYLLFRHDNIKGLKLGSPNLITWPVTWNWLWVSKSQ